MPRRNQLKEDIVISAMLFIMSTVIYFLIRFGKLHTMTHVKTGLAPAFFPELAFFLLIILSIILLILSLIKHYKENAETKAIEKLDRSQMRQVATVLFILFAYINLIGFIGYYISSFLTLITILLIFKVKTWYKIVVPSVILMMVVFLFFEKGLRILLPRGFLF